MMKRTLVQLSILSIAASGLAVAQGPGPNPFESAFARCNLEVIGLELAVESARDDDARAEAEKALTCSRELMPWALEFAKKSPPLIEAIKARQKAFAAYIDGMLPVSGDTRSVYRARVGALKAKVTEAEESIETEGAIAGLVTR